jgi:hypothetical protein
MGQIDASPHRVFRHLLDRGGVLREPVPGRIDFVHRLAELAPLSHLPSLSLNHVPSLQDLTPLSFLANPGAVGLRHCPALPDISALTSWGESLTRVAFMNCPRVDLAPLASLTALRTLVLGNDDEADLTPLAGKTDLTVSAGKDTRLIGEGLLGPGSKVERR